MYACLENRHTLENFCSCLQKGVANNKEPVLEKAFGLAPDQKERKEHQLQKQVFLFPLPCGQGYIWSCAWLWRQIELAVAAARRIWQGEQHAAIETAVQNALRVECEKIRKKLEKEKSSWNKERELLCSQVELLKAQQRTGEFLQSPPLINWTFRVRLLQTAHEAHQRQCMQLQVDLKTSLQSLSNDLVQLVILFTLSPYKIVAKFSCLLTNSFPSLLLLKHTYDRHMEALSKWTPSFLAVYSGLQTCFHSGNQSHKVLNSRKYLVSLLCNQWQIWQNYQMFFD